MTESDRWTDHGRRWAAEVMRRFEEKLWEDKPKPCSHDTHRKAPAGWECNDCKKRVVLSAEETTARELAVAQSDDPLQRWCVKHSKAYVNDGGGPGAFSFCPKCRYPS